MSDTRERLTYAHFEAGTTYLLPADAPYLIRPRGHGRYVVQSAVSGEAQLRGSLAECRGMYPSAPVVSDPRAQ